MVYIHSFILDSYSKDYFLKVSGDVFLVLKT